jgi:hypothetical protein
MLESLEERYLPSVNPISQIVAAAPIPNAAFVSGETAGVHNDASPLSNGSIIALPHAGQSVGGDFHEHAFNAVLGGKTSPHTSAVTVNPHVVASKTMQPQAGIGSGMVIGIEMGSAIGI